MLRMCCFYHLHNLKIGFAPEYTTRQKSSKGIYIFVLFASQLPVTKIHCLFLNNGLESQQITNSAGIHWDPQNSKAKNFMTIIA